LEEALPVLREIMESPTKHLTSWKIPLIVEPLVGKAWDGKHNWDKMKKGKDSVPDWLVGYVSPGEAVVHAPTSKPDPQPKSEAKVEPSPEALASTVQASAPATAYTPKPKSNGIQEVAVFSISGIFLTMHTLRLVKVAIALASDPEGKLLRLTDDSGTILIDNALGIKVNPEIFGHELRARNLGHGRYEIMMWS